MAMDEKGLDREQKWFNWASTLGDDEARCRASARVAAAVQETGAGFAAASAAARAAYSEGGTAMWRSAPAAVAQAERVTDGGPLLSADGRWTFGLSVAFPAVLTALYTSAVVVVYGVVRTPSTHRSPPL